MAMYDKLYGGYRIFVGDLGPKICRYDLEKEFDRHGRISDIWMARNPPGFAFIVYKHADAAEKAVTIMESRSICGRRIRVEHARPYSKHDKKKAPHHGRGEHYSRSFSSKYERRGRYLQRLTPSRSRTRSRSRSRSRHKRRSSPRRDVHHRRHSYNDRPVSRERERRKRHSGSRGRDRRKSISKERQERQGRKRSRSHDNDRWKRHRSEDSSDDEKYESRKSVLSEIKVKKKEESDKEKIDEVSVASKVVSLGAELEEDENMLPTIQMPPDDKVATTNDETEEMDVPVKTKDKEEEKVSEVSPVEKPDQKTMVDKEIITEDTKKDEGTQAEPTPAIPEKDRGEKPEPMEDSEAKESKGKKKVKTCTVETQTDDSHMEVDDTENSSEKNPQEKSPPEKTQSEISTQTKETWTKSVALTTTETQPIKKEVATEVKAKNKKHRSRKNSDAYTDHTNSNAKHVDSDVIDECKRHQKPKDVDVEREQEAPKIVKSVGDKHQKDSMTDTKNSNKDVGNADKKKIKFEFIQTGKKLLNGHGRNCVSQSKLLQPKVTRNESTDTESWTAGIVISDQASKILSPSDENCFVIKAM